jgi:hypothetical protein
MRRVSTALVYAVVAPPADPPRRVSTALVYAVVAPPADPPRRVSTALAYAVVVPGEGPPSSPGTPTVSYDDLTHESVRLIGSPYSHPDL